MKRLLATAAAIALLTTTAQADSSVKSYTLYKSKYWSTFATINNNPTDGDAREQCGVSTEGSDTARFYIKWTPNYGLRVQLWKKSWRLEEKSTVPFTVDFIDNAKPDNNKTLTVTNGWAMRATGGGTSVFASVHEDDGNDFMNSFRETDRIVVNFPEGDEPSWTMNGDGTRKAGEEFFRCVSLVRKSVKDRTAATQPVKPKATQPTTQPTRQRTEKGQI